MKLHTMVPNYMPFSLPKLYLFLIKNVFYVAFSLESDFWYPHGKTAEYWLQCAVASPATMSLFLFNTLLSALKFFIIFLIAFPLNMGWLWTMMIFSWTVCIDITDLKASHHCTSNVRCSTVSRYVPLISKIFSIIS